MDAHYWKSRCEAAEDALRRARSALATSSARKAVVQLLAELKPGQAMGTPAIAQQLGSEPGAVLQVLIKMADVGLVDRLPGGGRGAGNAVQWKLGHMVLVEPQEALE
jgi:hypothetical protein